MALEIIKCCRSAATVYSLTWCLKKAFPNRLWCGHMLNHVNDRKCKDSQAFWVCCFKSQVTFEVLESKSDQNTCLKDHFNYVYSLLMAFWWYCSSACQKNLKKPPYIISTHILFIYSSGLWSQLSPKGIIRITTNAYLWYQNLRIITNTKSGWFYKGNEKEEVL